MQQRKCHGIWSYVEPKSLFLRLYWVYLVSFPWKFGCSTGGAALSFGTGLFNWRISVRSLGLPGVPFRLSSVLPWLTCSPLGTGHLTAACFLGIPRVPLRLGSGLQRATLVYLESPWDCAVGWSALFGFTCNPLQTGQLTAACFLGIPGVPLRLSSGLAACFLGLPGVPLRLGSELEM